MSTGSATVASRRLHCKGDCSEQDEWRDVAPTSDHIRARAETEVAELFALVQRTAGSSEYEPFERELVARMFRFGRLLIALFLCLWHERTPTATLERYGKEVYRRQPAKPRLLGTYFGKVRYWRSYLYQQNGRPGGLYPVDLALGLVADGFCLGVLSRAVQLSTKMSFVASAMVFKSFLGWSPSHKTIEEATLGLGRFTAEWTEQRPAPEDDGEVLVMQVDSKATPTAREEELRKRRGPRRPNPYPDSPRHRGRDRRWRRGSKPRRKKGDKSKNGRAATLVVMYTLRRATGPNGEQILKGPVNRWSYASYAPKRHVFAMARREADKRGFTRHSGKRVQLLSDGDEDLERYAAEWFPEAEHTLDVIHAVEYLWKAGGCLYREGSRGLRHWVEMQKTRLYRGQARSIVRSLRRRRRDARSAEKRERLEKIAAYMGKRVGMMRYDHLDREDLELSTGIAEGAVRYIIGQRFDEGGMRWVKERAEALLQLRCIELNGEWDAFIDYVHAKLSRHQRSTRRQTRLLQNAPGPLPTLGVA